MDLRLRHQRFLRNLKKFGSKESEAFMKSVMFGAIAFVLVATAVGAYSADDHNGSPMGGMMQEMKG